MQIESERGAIRIRTHSTLGLRVNDLINSENGRPLMSFELRSYLMTLVLGRLPRQ